MKTINIANLNPPPEAQEVYDVAVIGCGVSGANIARKLSLYTCRIAVLEKAADVSFGTSKANSGIVHGGFHHNKQYLKARLEIQGNLMFDQLRRELDFPFKRCGILVAALHDDEMKSVEHLYMQGVDNGVIGIELCSRERILELEPKLSSDVAGGLYAPGGGIVEPYRFVFALVESAMKNGVHLYTDYLVEGAGWDEKKNLWTVRSGDGRTVSARYVVNAAGLFADDISKVFGGEEFTIKARKGEYFLMDRLTKARPDRVIFPVPTSVSKGMLVIPTVEGTVLVGPTADPVESKYDFATTGERLEQILDSGKHMVPSLSRSDVITSFAGLRPYLEEDFYIDISQKAPAFVQVAGIQSPGLTASPAIGEYVKDLLKKMGLDLTEKSGWDPFVEPRSRTRELTPFELDSLIAEDPAWGNIVCRCENVSEAEIVEAVRLGHYTLDGVKYFTRAQMGRCQGGFCTYKIIKIIMRETGLTWDEVTKHGGKSRVLEAEL
ncbi:NAD(P)/FAD-dependent oxidoreductase [Breznakiella homolactica]|uniref:FAD-dependent oxidoreductase n=1 Tax=Breznakiella homolactica TaxID=2798577 RepID=A0A7T8B9A9_9SPIR|nr:NAD(P)/FAD-dependent oxidoreductase [Breznakiella homolactica]QQO09439.1 FAD-dependent oxidoreductase [Breznakiella homolactica]